MNELSFVIALVFYFVGLGLITYWFAYQTVRVIKTVQKSRAIHRGAQAWVEVLDPQTLPAPEGRKESHFSGQGI